MPKMCIGNKENRHSETPSFNSNSIGDECEKDIFSSPFALRRHYKLISLVPNFLKKGARFSNRQETISIISWKRIYIITKEYEKGAWIVNRRETMEKCFDSIMELKGADEFKAMVKRLDIFLKNKEAYSLTDVSLPNYLWVARRGGGISTLVKTFAEYLYAARAIEFCGTVKSFEFKLDYIAPETFFSELTRLDNTISGFAGHNRFYKGVSCINIDEWLEHTNEDHFTKLLNYISSNSEKLLVIFCILNDDKNVIGAVESALSSHIRFESLSLRFPDSNELVELVESRHIQDKGFTLTRSAKTLLRETIEEIAAGKNFNGFKSISQLANDILYNILTTDFGDSKHISADMLSCCGKDSNYVKRARSQIGVKKVIGFLERSM